MVGGGQESAIDRFDLISRSRVFYTLTFIITIWSTRARGGFSIFFSPIIYLFLPKGNESYKMRDFQTLRVKSPNSEHDHMICRAGAGNAEGRGLDQMF